MFKKANSILFLSLLLILIPLAYFTKDLSKPILLSIPSCNIKVDCEYCVSENSDRLQSIIDKPNLAAWHNDFIFDHAGQDFKGLWNIKYGDEATFGTQIYSYAFTIRGYSDAGIYTKEGPLPKADLYLCTCVPNGAPYEIYIIGLLKK